AAAQADAASGRSDCFGTSLCGSTKGLATTVAGTIPDGVATDTSVPSPPNDTGSIASPMFFSSCGEKHAEVTDPTGSSPPSTVNSSIMDPSLNDPSVSPPISRPTI